MNHSTKAGILSSILALALLMAANLVGASEPAEQQHAPPSQPEQTDVGETQLRQFSAALSNVRAVQQEYSQAIQATQDTEEAQSLREEAQEDMVGAVEDAGLSVSEYNQISQAIQKDPDLARRVDDMLE